MAFKKLNFFRLKLSLGMCARGLIPIKPSKIFFWGAGKGGRAFGIEFLRIFFFVDTNRNYFLMIYVRKTK